MNSSETSLQPTVTAEDPNREVGHAWKTSEDAAGSARNVGTTDRHELPVCFEELVERCMGNIDLATRLLNQSQDLLVEDLQGLQECDEALEPDEMVRLAHRLKGATANLGAHQLSDVFARMEKHGRAGVADSMPACRLDLETEWARFIECVAELCDDK